MFAPFLFSIFIIFVIVVMGGKGREMPGGDSFFRFFLIFEIEIV